MVIEQMEIVEFLHKKQDEFSVSNMALSILKLINPRCGIPVVIMGETGCGKTCLIRYMCGLQSGPGGPKNMLLMKVRI